MPTIHYPIHPIKKSSAKPAIKKLRVLNLNVTLAQYLQAGSVFGGTTLEQLVDGAAAQIGIHFDAAQFTIYLGFGNERTVVDRMIYNPLTAVFIDGIQHDMRPETKQGDQVKREALRGMGYRVAVLNWKDLLVDPIGTVRTVQYAI
jgi:hypothetical protein